MTDKPTITIADPHQVPVVFSSHVAGVGYWDGVMNITLCAAQFTPDLRSTAIPLDLAISARLRIPLGAAKDLYDRMGAMLAQAGVIPLHEVHAPPVQANIGVATEGKPN
jgi:hypothetical protein